MSVFRPFEQPKLPKDCTEEVLEKRNLVSKTFAKKGGGFRWIGRTGTQIHYRENNEFKEIDLTFRQDGGIWVLDTAPYIIELLTDDIGYKYTSRTTGKEIIVRLAELNDQGVDKLPILLNFSPDGNELHAANLVSDFDIFFYARPRRFSINKVLKSELAPTKLKWIVEQDDPSYYPMVFAEGIGRDNQDLATSRETELYPKRKLEVNVYETKPEKKGLKWQHEITEEFTGRMVKTERDTHISTWDTEVAYPARFNTTVNESIPTDNDDGYDDGAWVANTYGGGYYWHRISHNVPWYAGWRFTSVDVPQGATINLATINARVLLVNDHTNTYFYIYADDVDDAPAWSDTSRPASGFTKTTNKGNKELFPNSGSPPIDEQWDCTAAVQEVVNRGSWAANNDIRLAAFTTEGYGDGRIYDYKSGTTNCPELSIDYTVGGQIYELSANIQGATSTPDNSGLSILREIMGNIQCGSSTPDTLTLEIILQFLANIQAGSVTPDTVALEILRALTGNIQGISATPDTVTLNLLRALMASIQATTGTPDTLSLAILRTLQASISGGTSTPDTVALLIIKVFSASIAAGSSLPDDVTLNLLKALSANIQGATETSSVLLSVLRQINASIAAQSYASDDVDLLIAGLIELSATIAAASSTSDSVVLSVLRTFMASVEGQSLTPDDVALGILRALSAAISGATSTPDIDLLIIKIFGATIQVSSQTADVALAILRELDAAITAESVTSDSILSVLRSLTASMDATTLTSAINLITAGLGVIVDAMIESLSTQRIVESLSTERELESLSVKRTIEQI